MSNNIYLSGGGSAKDSYRLDDMFLKEAGERILYLPIGLRRTFAGYDECVTWFTEMISLHKLPKRVSVWVDIENKAKELNRNNFDAVYIGGASDTMRLHSLLQENDFYPQLKKFINEEGIIYGGSGGASVLGKSINYDQIEKTLPKINGSASDLCGGYSIFAHLNEKNKKIVEDFSEGNVIGIPEGGGCVLDTFQRLIMYIGTPDGIVIDHAGSRILRNMELIQYATIGGNNES